MGNYENGVFTRRAIVDACKKLFYEKGYHKTSYGDICKEAHVIRSTIYYHFPNKELIRLEVQWEFYIDCKHIAERYCPDSRYCGILAMALLWQFVHNDKNLRRYTSCIYHDHLVYSGKKDVSYFFYAACDYMWSHFLDKTAISPMDFSSVYGYVVSCGMLICEHPERYDTWEFFEHCCRCSLLIWGASDDLIEEIFSNAKQYYDALPADAWKLAKEQAQGANVL